MPPSAPQLSLHVACAAQVTAQSAAHLTSQLEVSLHATVLPAPRLNLQSALLEQVAEERAPAFSSHLELATHVIALASPPLPLHSELSLHMSLVAPTEAALHFAPVSQRMAQPAALQVVLQSVPAVQAQSFSWVQAQPTPVHVAGVRPASSFEQATVVRQVTRSKPRKAFSPRMMDPTSRLGQGYPDGVCTACTRPRPMNSIAIRSVKQWRPLACGATQPPGWLVHQRDRDAAAPP